MELSKAMLSTITHKIIPVLREWGGRQLEEVYPLVWMDALVITVREEGFVRKKRAYGVLAVNSEGTKDLVGIYLSRNRGSLVLVADSLPILKNLRMHRRS